MLFINRYMTCIGCIADYQTGFRTYLNRQYSRVKKKKKSR